MNGSIEGLREAVRENLESLSASFERLRILIDGKPFATDSAMRKALARLEILSKQNREKLAAAHPDFERWMIQELSAREKVSLWKAKRDSSRLHFRADLCEKSANAALEIAALAIQEAECAALRAIFARKEAVSVQVRER
jgi:hypothetical protein